MAWAVYPVSNPWPTGDHAADKVASNYKRILDEDKKCTIAYCNKISIKLK